VEQVNPSRMILRCGGGWREGLTAGVKKWWREGDGGGEENTNDLARERVRRSVSGRRERGRDEERQGP